MSIREDNLLLQGFEKNIVSSLQWSENVSGRILVTVGEKEKN